MFAVLFMCAVQTYFLTCMFGTKNGVVITDAPFKGLKAKASKSQLKGIDKEKLTELV